MELDELKGKLNQRMAVSQQHSAGEISAMLQKQATSVVQKIKRSLWIEFILSVIFTISCGFTITFIEEWAYLMFLIGATIVGLIVSALLGFLVWKTNKLSNSSLSIRKNLETIISIIYRYVWLYLRLGIGLIPLCFGLALWLSYYPVDGVFKPFYKDNFIFLLIGILIFSYLSFRFTKWYLKKLYGNYVEQLENLLQELESGE